MVEAQGFLSTNGEGTGFSSIDGGGPGSLAFCVRGPGFSPITVEAQVVLFIICGCTGFPLYDGGPGFPSYQWWRPRFFFLLMGKRQGFLPLLLEI